MSDTRSLIRSASRELAWRAKSRHEDPELIDLARDLLAALRISYPATSVDCLISELSELFGMNGRAYLMKGDFEARVAQFKDEVAG